MNKIIQSHDEYVANPAISRSELINMRVCPLYFKYMKENPQEQTDALTMGIAFHKLVLEPQTFNDEYAVIAPYDRRTKAGKEYFENFMAQADGKTVISTEQFETITAMRDSIVQYPYLQNLISGKVENSFYFTDDLTGEEIKVRPDCYSEVSNNIIITDLKSCSSALKDDITRDVVKYGYDLQAYMYSLGVSKVLNIPFENILFVFIFVEKKPPYLFNIVQVTADVLKRGECLFREYIGKYHECKQSGVWYGLNGRFSNIGELTLPDYLLKKDINGE